MIIFVGEEKNDSVTRMYNETMKRILPEYGIELIEIPRIGLNVNGDPICATTVRSLLDAGKIDEVKEYVPESTMNIL